VENLLDNARDALAGEANARIWLEVRTEDSHVQVRVADNGPGVPAEIVDKLFQPFTTEGKAHGTGLGLAIVRNLVQAHNGTVEYDATGTEGGAGFIIELPRLRPADPPTATTLAPPT
jgi:two-component system C4-dicarboxylate transport sensor histidine kinase DctB